jgi:hypothetical protein
MTLTVNQLSVLLAGVFRKYQIQLYVDVFHTVIIVDVRALHCRVIIMCGVARIPLHVLTSAVSIQLLHPIACFRSVVLPCNVI